MDAWKFKTMHDSTFEATDVAHKMIDAIYVSTVAGAAIFIRPVAVSLWTMKTQLTILSLS